MRTPKFRAWIKDKHKMVDVCCLSIIEGKLYIISYGNNPYSWYEFELMEFIGLKDKNGKEIYEGDLVRYIDGDKEIICPVRFIKKYACFGVEWGNGLSVTFEYLISFYAKPEDLEVVGNIYEGVGYGR